jgi:hypothetical protein
MRPILFSILFAVLPTMAFAAGSGRDQGEFHRVQTSTCDMKERTHNHLNCKFAKPHPKAQAAPVQGKTPAKTK